MQQAFGLHKRDGTNAKALRYIEGDENATARTTEREVYPPPRHETRKTTDVHHRRKQQFDTQHTFSGKLNVA